MKRLLVRLALYILSKWSLQPVELEVGRRFFWKNRAYVIYGLAVEMDGLCVSRIHIEAREGEV